MEATYLKSITKPDQVKIVKIESIYEEITSDKLSQQTSALRNYYKLYCETSDSNKKIEYKTEYDNLKNQLPNVVFAGEFSKRAADSCTLYWANIILDIDKIKDEKDLVKIKEYFKKDPATVLIFISPSGKGLKVVQNVNYNDEEKIKFHKLAFTYLKNLHNSHLKKYGVEIDSSGSDISRTCFLCYDPKSYFNKNPLPKVVEIKEITPDKEIKKTNDFYHTFDVNANENKEIIEDIIDFCETNNIDLTKDYVNWLSVMFGLKNTFNDSDGLAYFIAISKIFPGFNLEETQKKWNDNKVDERKPKVTLGTIIYLAKQFGYKIKRDLITKNTLWNNLIEELFNNNVFVRFEEDSHRLQIKRDDHWDYLTDTDEARIRFNIFKNKIQKADIVDFLYNISPKISIHSEFLRSLPKWDGVDRFEQLSDTLKYSRESDFQKTLKPIFIKKWFVGVIAGLHNSRQKPMKNENILVFTGTQYIGKTRWCEKLLPKEWNQYFCTKNINTENKDDLLLLTNKFIIFLEEGISLQKTDVKAMKSLTSMANFSLRKPYGHHNEDYLRFASFISTTNEYQILSDDTGNRRYWIIETDDIKYDHNIDMYQVWAQSYQLFNEDYKYWLTDEEFEMIKEYNKTYEIENPLEEYINKHFKKDENGKLTATEVLEFLIQQYKEIKSVLPTNLNVYSIGRVLKKMGYVKKSVRICGSPRIVWSINYKEHLENIEVSEISNKKIFNIN